MGKRRRQAPSNNNLAVGILFCFFILILLVGSFSLKIFDLLRKSSFDNQERFTVAFSNNNTTPNELVYVMSFVPESKSISVLVVPELLKNDEGTRVITAENVGRFLGVPIDGTVIPEKQNTVQFTQNSLAETTLMYFGSVATHLTILDVVRLWLYEKTVSPANIKVVKLDTVLDEPARDKVVQSLFLDNTFSVEKFSIEVVNTTETQGLGNRLARYITNGGGNVVAVTSSASPKEESEIRYSGDESYTVKKLSRVLGISTLRVQEKGISDIIIILGKDQEKRRVF